MGWNFSIGKGGMIAGLVACWVAGLLYTCVAMIDSEVTSTVAAAGGQYAQAKHIVGPLMAFNVGLFPGHGLHDAGGRQCDHHRLPARYRGRHAGPFRAQPAAVHHPGRHVPGMAQLSRRAGDAHFQFRHHRDRLPGHHHSVPGRAVRRARTFRSIFRRSPPIRCPMAGSASSHPSISGSGIISASRAPARRPRKCVPHRARSLTARWPAS